MFAYILPLKIVIKIMATTKNAISFSQIHTFPDMEAEFT